LTGVAGKRLVIVETMGIDALEGERPSSEIATGTTMRGSEEATPEMKSKGISVCCNSSSVHRRKKESHTGMQRERERESQLEG